MNSIMSFPERGPWGDSRWRGNTSGHVYKSLFEQLRPQTFVDPMCGSKTSAQVAEEMKIRHWSLDLHSGFNAIRDSIRETVGQEVDLVLSHPPYGGMITYSNHVWGEEAHADDLSRCSTDEEFHEKMQLVLLNQRDATRDGGFYGTLIGDWRRNGIYTSYQAELIARLPRDELASVIIKVQHNCTSDRKTYARMTLPRVAHEYVILWQKRAAPILVLLRDLAKDQQARLTGTWKTVVRLVLMKCGGSSPLERIYAAVANAAPEKLAANPNWRAKVRQILNSNADLFRSSERGNWQLA